MSVVQQPVEDGIGERGDGDDLVPAIHRDLAGDQGRAGVVAVLDDLQKITRLFGQERLGAPIVEDQQVHLRDLAQQPAVAAITTCKAKRRKQTRDPVVQDREVVPAGLVPERAGQPALAHAAGAGDHEVAPGPEAPVQFAMLTAGQEKPRRPPRRWTPPDWTRDRSHPGRAALEGSDAEPDAHHAATEARGLQLAPQPRRVAFAFVEPPHEVGHKGIGEAHGEDTARAVWLRTAPLPRLECDDDTPALPGKVGQGAGVA